MSLKSKALQIILSVICGIFVVLAIFLGVLSIIFSGGNGAPNVFGSNIYLVKTEAFGFLHNGTAIMAKQVPYAEIQNPNIVIFDLENGKPALAQIVSSELSDGTYSFKAITENNAEITLRQDQVVAKGMRYSDFWGALISFAVSPVGMMVIAITPSIIMIVLELLRFARKILPQPEIETVKKQYETPTYSKEKQQGRERRGMAEAARAYKGAALDSSIGMYDAAVKKATTADKERSEYMESLARQQTAPLYTSPQREPQRQRSTGSTMPLSQKKLNDAIAEAKMEHEMEEMQKKRSQIVKDIQRTRGAMIAAEKEYETNERLLTGTAERERPEDNTKTTVMEHIRSQPEMGRKLSPEQLRSQARQQRGSQPERSERVQLRRPAQLPQPRTVQPGRVQQPERIQQQPEQPAEAPARRVQRPALRLGQEENARAYPSQPAQRVGTNTTTSIPRLDAVLRDDGDLPNIEDILAGLDRKK